MAFRRHLWSHGFAVAEAMDTAQRGMGLGYAEGAGPDPAQRGGSESGVKGAVVFSGVGTDHLRPRPDRRLTQIRAAYLKQLADVEAAGSGVIMMASRALAAAAKGPDDYAASMTRFWPGARAGDHPLAGRHVRPRPCRLLGFGRCRHAMDTCLAVITANAAKIDGIKISLLSKEAEIGMRRRLPKGIRMYTGDDFNYAELIAGDAQGYSHALLGIFDAIAPAASAALKHLAAGNTQRFNEILAPTVPLSRHIFKAPTRFYKTGVVFLPS